MRVDDRAALVLHHVRLEEHALAAHVESQLAQPRGRSGRTNRRRSGGGEQQHVGGRGQRREVRLVPRAMRGGTRRRRQQRLRRRSRGSRGGSGRGEAGYCNRKAAWCSAAPGLGVQCQRRGGHVAQVPRGAPCVGQRGSATLLVVAPVNRERDAGQRERQAGSFVQAMRGQERGRRLHRLLVADGPGAQGGRSP